MRRLIDAAGADAELTRFIHMGSVMALERVGLCNLSTGNRLAG